MIRQAENLAAKQSIDRFERTRIAALQARNQLVEILVVSGFPQAYFLLTWHPMQL